MGGTAREAATMGIVRRPSPKSIVWHDARRADNSRTVAAGTDFFAAWSLATRLAVRNTRCPSIGTNGPGSDDVIASIRNRCVASRRHQGGPCGVGACRCGRIVATRRNCPMRHCGQRSYSRRATRRRNSATDSTSAACGGGMQRAARASASPRTFLAGESKP